jgi:transposase-like protein
MEKKRKRLSLETKYDILWEIEKGNKTKTEIAKDFQIPKSTLSDVMSKKEINDYFF